MKMGQCLLSRSCGVGAVLKSILIAMAADLHSQAMKKGTNKETTAPRDRELAEPILLLLLLLLIGVSVAEASL